MIKCPKCQHKNPEDAKFCQECGSRLYAASETVKTSSIPEAERKRVTALFSDLTGYTAMTERLDPEEVKEITGRIFNGVKAVVSKYEGFIEKFMGDGVLALFGVPRAHEDDPIRAIRAALEIHGLVEALSPHYKTKIGRALSMHSGINTGLVVTADVNPEKGTHSVTGETINVAARLSDLAEARDILVGSDTYRASQTHFTFQSLKPAKVKGKSEPIPIYKVLSEKTATARVSQEMQVSSEMVGRDQELAKLELHILKAVNGQGSVVNVFGEPGVGKSRLLAELRQRDVISRVSLLEGRSISIGKNLSFHPIIDLFKQWARIREDDAQAEASNRLETAIRRVCGDETDEVFPFVSIMMGMKLSGKHSQRLKGIEGEALEKLILKNVRELLIRSSELIPIVIVMEDLHWADTTSLELLESLFRLARTYRVVFINVFRPGYWQGDDRKVETLPEWLPEIDFAEIAIRPLDRQTGEALVNNMLQVKGLPYAVKKQIVDRSGGNPFFMEEVVHSLIDEGAIVRTNGVFQVTEKIDHVVIPSTINDVLTARIDRLEGQTRDLIKVASVIGRSFFDRILKEVADSIEGVDERLAYLKNAQFIRDRMRMEELEYLFKHALAQEAAYESTLIQQRKELHLKVAQSIEKVFQERLHEFYGMLAFHYSKADDPEKTEEYMVKAGDEALRSSASSEALHYFQEALQLYLTKYGNDADPAKLASFEKNIALAFYNKAQWAQAVEYFDSVLQRWGTPVPKKGPAGIAGGIRDLLVLLKVIYWKLPNSKKIPRKQDIEAFDFYYRQGLSLSYIDHTRFFLGSLDLFRRTTRFDLSKIPRLSIYWSGISTTFSVSGLSFRLSNRLFEISKRYRVAEDIGSRVNHVCMSNLIYLCQGAWGKIKYLDEDLLNSSLRIGDFWHTSNYLWSCGKVKGEQGGDVHLLEVVDKLYEIGENYDYGQAIANARHLKADYLLKVRSAHKALSEAQQGSSYTREKALEVYEILFLGYKAEAQQLTGDAEGARDSISQASELYEKQSFVVMPIFVAPYLASCFFVDVEELKHAIRSDTSLDVTHVRKRVYKSGKTAVRNSRKYAPYRTKILRLMGLYYWLIGKQAKALKWWNKAIKEGERLGARPDLSRTYFEVGKRLLEPQSKYKELNGIDAKGYLEKARVLFEEMGLERDLDDLDKIASDS
ncbi:MAG: AAA family ATPase [Deltaproteobacteria bacterium]|nr:AAA family ATPase [Deltaproteobacteria bacterium]